MKYGKTQTNGQAINVEWIMEITYVDHEFVKITTSSCPSDTLRTSQHLYICRFTKKKNVIASIRYICLQPIRSRICLVNQIKNG